MPGLRPDDKYSTAPALAQLPPASLRCAPPNLAGALRCLLLLRDLLGRRERI